VREVARPALRGLATSGLCGLAVLVAVTVDPIGAMVAAAVRAAGSAGGRPPHRDVWRTHPAGSDSSGRSGTRSRVLH
jgi:hypothetical protein